MMAQPGPVDLAALLPRERQPWMGDELLGALGALRTKDSLTGQDLVWVFEAARWDAKRQDSQKNYSYAASSYKYASNIAQRLEGLPLDVVKELLIGLTEVSLKIKDLQQASVSADDCIRCAPNYSKGYKLMSEVGVAASDPSLAVRVLLDGMTRCSLSADETVDFVVTACQQIVRINSSGVDAWRLAGVEPNLPDAPQIWKKILQRLFDSKSFAALALVTSGLADPHMPTHLDLAAKQVDVDCSQMNVEKVVDTLNRQQMKAWGAELAIFIIDHRGQIGRDTQGPFVLVQLAVKTGCCKVIRHVLGKKNWHRKRDINQQNSLGSTGLHVAVKETSGVLLAELVSLLLDNGACSNIRDKKGKMPRDCVLQNPSVVNKLNQSHSFESIKAKGNDAHKNQKHLDAVRFYKEAVEELSGKKCGSLHHRDLAVLHFNMATSYMAMNKKAEGKDHAQKSIKADPTYFKPYFRLGKILVMEHQQKDACDVFCKGLLCEATKPADRVEFLVEIALLVPHLTDEDRILKRVSTHLKECWPKVFAALCKKNYWDVICHLVLGPPFRNADDLRTDGWSFDGWRFSDQYTTDQRIRVGHAMSFELKTTTSVASILDAFKGQTGALFKDYAADLVLALLLQGAELESLLQKNSESCYHVALRLCCLTGKLGLMRYILSEEPHLKEALKAVDDEGKSLLHLACVLDRSTTIGEQVILLLFEKGFDPVTKDSSGKQAVFYLTRDSSSVKLFGTDTPKSTASSRSTPQQAASGKDSHSTADKRESPVSSSCRSCSKLLGCAKKSFKKNTDIAEAVRKLVQLFDCQHSPSIGGNIELEQGAMDLLVTNLTTSRLEKDILSIIFELSETRLQLAVQSMVEYRRWEELKVFLRRGEKQGRSLASKVSVGKHVISKETSSFPDSEVFDMLLHHGAKLPDEEYHSVVQTALERSQMGLVEVLLCAKEDCKDFSPVHTAFDIALYKVKGNFTLFDSLRLRYDSRAKDEEGNTLLHLALKAVASSHSQEAVERLVLLGLVQDGLNNDKMMAVDYLKKSNDKRADILIKHFITGMVKLSDEELQVARARKDKWLEVNRPEKSKKTSARDEHLQGAEGGKDPSTKASGPQPRTAENQQQIKEDEQLDDLKFEGLLWEVVLTEEVHRKLNSKKVPPHTRKKIINIIKQLASGETRRKDFRELQNAKPISLYEANITRGERLIYEIAVDFSPSQKVYTDVIRVWDIVLDHDKITPSVKRIKDSSKRGKGCKSWVKLKALPDSSGAHKDLLKPRTYTKLDGDTERGDITVYPPASADETEYQILKFFTVTSNMELAWLQKSDVKTDFLFRVKEREVVIIELDTGAPVLLIGRSGTGKTTCCLYRLMICFLKYWTDTREKGYQPQLTFRKCFARDKDHGEADCEKDSGLKGTEEAPTGGAGYVDGACGGVPEESEHDQPFASNTSRCKAKQREMETMATTSSTRLITEKVHLHQMFVTKNPVLCEAVQKNFKELCHAEPVAEHHTAIEEEPVPHRLQEVDDYQFPLFLTLWKLILMLDASLPPPHFFKRNKDGSLSVTLPEESSAIHFLHGYTSEEESDEDEEEEEETGRARPSRKQHSLESDPRRKVTYELFVQEIWPHLKKGETVGYHPSLVWMEITSFIKGSLEAVNSPNGYLDFKSYEEVGRNQAPNFVGERQKIYTLFESYKKYIHRKWMYDDADLLFHIFRRLKQISLGHSQPKNPEESEQLGPEWVIHEMYVDETQDFTQAELFLLMCLTDQPNRMFLTGDTAQSIMRGVAFRFTDLKTLFHRAKDMSVLSGHSQLQVPKDIYKLTQNYRSHDGILRLASGILDLLYFFFPKSFDPLARDKGLFGGPKPVLVESASPADLVTFLAGNQRETSHIGFGAHQVILVVNDEARKALPEEMSRALRLTIYEAKGLEFDDVLLYNFFKDSQAKKEWKVVLSNIDKLRSAAAEEKDDQTSSSAGGLVCTHEDELKRRPTASRDFDEKKHKILNSELKHLYTAVTRARANVYIFDEDEEKRRPMFEYFKQLQLAESKDALYCSGGGAQDSFAKKSSPEEWEKRGTEFMNRKLYDIAVDCYSNAGNELLRNIAIAHSRLNTALMQPQSRILDDATKTAYLKAAILFLECQAESQKQKQPSEQRFYLSTEGACRCLDKAGKHSHAAEVFEKNKKLREAAIQYEKAEKWEQASMCHEQMLDYHRALTCLVRGKLFDKALDCLQRFGIDEQKCKDSKEWPQKVMVKPGTEFTVPNLRLRKAEECHTSGEKEEMLRTLTDLDPEEQIAFLQNRKHFDLAAKKMVQRGNRPEAVWMLLRNGIIDMAIEHAEESKDIELRAHCYLNKARQLIHSEASSEKESTHTGLGKPKNTVPETWDRDLREAEQLVDEALKLFKQCSKHNEAGECLLLLAQLKGDKNYVFDALKFFQQKGHLANFAAVLECYETLYKPAECLKMDTFACQHLLEGMDYSSELVLLLLDGEHSNSQYRQCLHFFGLDVPDSNSLTFYPCLNPRWLEITKKKCESNTETLSGKDRMQALKTLASFLAQRARGWYQAVHDFIERGLKQEMQCPELQSGSKCSHHPTHKEHPQDPTGVILKLLAEGVWLDHSTASFARCLPTTPQDVDVFTKPFESVEHLLSFILPEGLPRYRMTFVYGFCRKIQERKSRMSRCVYDQIEKYIDHLRKPVQGSLEEDGILKEQCRSTKWIVQASLISMLFGLQDKVDDFCSEVELELSKIPKPEAQRWMKKTGEYAVWTDKELKTRMHLARRYLDAVSFLLGLTIKESSGRFNPTEALEAFTKFTKLLGDKGQVHQMPHLHHFLFLIEVFTTLAFYLVDKCSGSHSANALPACYFRNLHMLNLVEPGGQDTLQVWMENHSPRDSNDKASRKFVLGRIQYLTRVLCGVRQGDFSLLGYLSKLDKKEPSHFLLLERALVVSLVLLLNCRLEGVSDEHLVPILRTVKGLCENTQGMPDRLKSLAESVRDAQDYSHIFNALANALKGMGEQLQFYRWHWKDKGCMPQVEQKPNIPQGPLPSLEMVLKKDTGERHGPEASESVQDGFNQHAQNEDAQEEDEEMVSAEDRANLKQRLVDRRAANAISCWKEFVKRNREKKISGDRDLDIMTFFLLKPITETSCGICGESYEQASVDEMEIQTEDLLEDEGMIPAVSKAKRLTQRQEHEISWYHQQEYSEYLEFRKVCQTDIAGKMHEIGVFFSNIQIEKKAALYKDHPHEFHSYEKYKKVRQAVQHAIANKNWGEQESLCQLVAELQSIIRVRDVKTIFCKIFNDNENSQGNRLDHETSYSLKNVADFLR